MAMTAHDLVPWLHWCTAHGPLLVGVTGGLALGIHLLRLVGRRSRREPEARWASWRDLRQAYLLGTTGVVLGRVGGTILRYAGRGHLLWVAATQSGKSQMLKATLLEPQPGTSIFAHDPKDELYASTAQYRATVSRVIRLAPCDEQSDCYNPLAALRLGTDHEVGDLQQFAKLLANPEGLTVRTESERHFVGLAEMALSGLTCYGMQTAPPLVTCLGDLYSVVSQGAFRAILRDMQTASHPLVRMAGTLLGEMDEKQYANVYTTLVRVLELYADPLLAGMTSRSDFTLEEVRQGTQPLTLYLSIPFAHLDRMRPFTCLLTQQLLSRATEVPNDWRRHGYWKVLALGEEFPSLKHLQIAADIYNQGAGLGVQLCLIAPSLNAIEDIWGAKHNFLDNAHVQVFFGLTDDRVAQRVSARLGTHAVTKERVSWSRGRRTVSREQVREPLLDSSAITHMDPDDVIIIARNHQVIARQTPWDAYRPWKDRGVAA